MTPQRGEWYRSNRVSNVAFESSMPSMKKDSSSTITAFTNNYNIMHVQSASDGAIVTGETS